MRPQDIVAIILAVGIVLLLMSGTSFMLFWMTPEDYVAARSAYSPNDGQFWTNTVDVIIGALAGYIAGRHNKEQHAALVRTPRVYVSGHTKGDYT